MVIEYKARFHDVLLASAAVVVGEWRFVDIFDIFKHLKDIINC